MQLPDSFIHTIRTAFEKDGETFLTALPLLIEEASQRWGLSDVQAVPNLSYNFVAFAKQGKYEVILKLGVPNDEIVSEMNTLKLFNGEGACRLLDCDEAKGFLLIERLHPGQMLADLQDDDERTHIAMDVMLKLTRPAPENGQFLLLEDWFAELKNVRPKFDGETGPFPPEIFKRVEALLPELFVDDDFCLMHGDFHHYNILSSERGWLVIDPKGVIGPAGYEIGPLMTNPFGILMDRTNFKVQTERRVAIIHERTNWAREKIINWALAHSVLSAYWDLDLDPNETIEMAKIFSGIK
ncbi:MAG: phosphotransferase [Anaerolineae bacterium]|nr:phosphotransferase [Anaerolineae bacterium]